MKRVTRLSFILIGVLVFWLIDYTPKRYHLATRTVINLTGKTQIVNGIEIPTNKPIEIPR